jgi:transcriptional regulator with XRE-family HTH domain
MRQSELARKLGETEVWVSRRLRGIQALSLSDIERIARVLQVEPVELLRSAVASAVSPTCTKSEQSVRPKGSRPKGRADSRSPMDGPGVRRPRRLIAREPEAISLSAA